MKFLDTEVIECMAKIESILKEIDKTLKENKMSVMIGAYGLEVVFNNKAFFVLDHSNNEDKRTYILPRPSGTYIRPVFDPASDIEDAEVDSRALSGISKNEYSRMVVQVHKWHLMMGSVANTQSKSDK